MQITLDMLSALKYLHIDKKIMHRDINPSNVMMSYDYKIKVTDFGLSSNLCNSLAKDEAFLGTLAYSS
jgi:serine/threonine protein kinase